jgi:hypothetical protein
VKNQAETIYGEIKEFTTSKANSLLSYSSNFNNNLFDTDFWIKNTEDYNGNDIRVEDGIMKLEQNFTDVKTDLVSVELIFNNTIEVERNVFLYKANNYFTPEIIFYFNNSDFFAIRYSYNNWDSNYNVCLRMDDNADNKNSAFIKLPYNTILDEWFHEKIVINNGMVEYFLNGNSLGQYDISKISSGATSFHLNIHPYGWWTGHKHYFDNFLISGN